LLFWDDLIFVIFDELLLYIDWGNAEVTSALILRPIFWSYFLVVFKIRTTQQEETTVLVG
jgi:hypothetical protein